LHALKFSPQIDVGSLVTASAVMCSLAAWLLTVYSRDEQSVRELASVQGAVSAQISDLRNVIASGLVDVHQEISTLPDQRAKLEQVERRLSDIESKLNNEDQHLGLLERSTIETRADVNTMMRATNAPLLPLIGKSNRP
jgi:peptidoglycan hydrolase CwlO-like protein